MLDRSLNFSDYEFDWIDAYVKSDVKLSIQPFFSYTLVDDPSNDFQTRIVYIYPPKASIDKTLFKNKKSIKSKSKNKIFRQKLKNLLASLESDLDDQDLSRDIDELVEFEKHLIYISNLKSFLNDTNGAQRMTFRQLNYTFPEINWIRIFSEIFDSFGIKLNKDEPVLIENNYYFVQLEYILNKHEKYTSRTLANYIGVKILLEFGENMILRISSVAESLDEISINWHCYQFAEDMFQTGLNFLYGKHYFHSNILIQFETFVKQLRDSITSNIQRSELMDKITKLRLQSKIDETLDQIDSSLLITDEREIDNFYGDLGFIPSSDFFKAFKKARKFHKRHFLRALRSKQNLRDFDREPNFLLKSQRTFMLENNDLSKNFSSINRF
ncbi:endothelin-converting enzyme 1-like protein [Dinothrombium tinctorium]|uniref:Endothelin-converting enzyme 1-like protein n=1 Tax=Dinothrombium tinctorium TaxID=1965070 RepID=A0A3S3PCB4_9ACAR|nr:endothelin-converting enzyme 1-like protein [Dinothrombium tinctorium]